MSETAYTPPDTCAYLCCECDTQFVDWDSASNHSGETGHAVEVDYHANCRVRPDGQCVSDLPCIHGPGPALTPLQAAYRQGVMDGRGSSHADLWSDAALLIRTRRLYPEPRQ